MPDLLVRSFTPLLRAFAQTQKLPKQIAGVNLELLKERKRQRQ